MEKDFMGISTIHILHYSRYAIPPGSNLAGRYHCNGSNYLVEESTTFQKDK